MTKKSKWFVLPLAIILVLALALVGCMPSTPAPAPAAAPKPPVTPLPAPQLSGEIKQAGSTTVQPVAETLANAFTKKHPKVKIDIQGGGSSVGIKAVAAGTVDIGASSRELTADEKKLGVVEHLLALDAIAIITHPAQKVTNITKAQAQEIFSGKIKNWREVGGDNKAINVVSREEGSGTRAAFEEMVMGKGVVITATAILQPSSGAVRTTVAGDPDAIGYLSLGYLDKSVKALSIDGAVCSVDNVKAGKYPIVRPLLFLTKGQPQGVVSEFIKFCLGPEGQTIVAKDYISPY